MKKRFTLMMMVLCILMSIPLKMMAKAVTISYIDDENWSEIWAYVYSDGGQIGPDWGGTQCKTITTNADGQRVATWTFNLDDNLAKAYVVFNNGKGNNKQHPAQGVKWIIEDGASYNKDGKITSSGGGSGSGSGSGTGSGTGGTTGPTEKWETEKTNRLTEKPRVYTQGFYLAGDFFTFDTGGINYKDAVFKFQQQNDQSINETAETPYDVYMVEIPASLDAHAQVMYVDETGTAVKLFCPINACGISETYPSTAAKSTNWETLNGTVKFSENNNYWNFTSRNKTKDNYSDGMYEVYIAVDKNSHEPAKWMIKHQAKKRVAYFISDAPDATAIPLYDAYKQNQDQFGNKFFATVNLADNRSYYVISNYVRDNKFASLESSERVESLANYNVTVPSGDIISCPTTNKLFLLGNAAKDIALTDETNQFNEFSPNEKPMPGARSGMKQSVAIVEYNPSNGNFDSAKLDNHLGIRGQVIVRSDRVALTSVSLVGDAIPGTLNADKTWNYKSNVADMTFDETEQCYKATVVTTVADDGKSKFRFVGNRDPKITWYENTDGNVPADMAKHPHDSESAPGHTVDANDPNEVNYTQDGVNPEKDWDIIWNRPAGRWTVRLYFYTYSDGNDPKTKYYYTITASNDMVLHDVTDIVYDSKDNIQNIYNKGEYKFLRTWSAIKTWKISNKVDVFVVTNVAPGKTAVQLFLKNINKLDETGKYHVIPAKTGVILATKSDASDIAGARFEARQNYKSYNELVIPMEENGSVYEYEGTDNLLVPLYYSKIIPASDEKNFNYFFAYYNARIATNDEKTCGASDYLLGFWISKGSKPYQSNSSYLQISKEKAATLNRLGTSYDDFYTGGSAKKVPGVIFDFDNVGGTTGINEVVNQSTKLNDGKYYTLSGQQVEKPTAGGIYIHNGRKFVVK